MNLTKKILEKYGEEKTAAYFHFVCFAEALSWLLLFSAMIWIRYDDQGLLNHVGFTSAIPAAERSRLTGELEKLIEPPGFTGSAPGGPSRWNTERTTQWQPLRPVLVVEVRYDQVTGDRFRHGTGLLRFRPDKDPKQCTFDQLAPELRPSELEQLFAT